MEPLFIRGRGRVWIGCACLKTWWRLQWSAHRPHPTSF